MKLPRFGGKQWSLTESVRLWVRGCCCLDEDNLWHKSLLESTCCELCKVQGLAFTPNPAISRTRFMAVLSSQDCTARWCCPFKLCCSDFLAGLAASASFITQKLWLKANIGYGWIHAHLASYYCTWRLLLAGRFASRTALRIHICMHTCMYICVCIHVCTYVCHCLSLTKITITVWAWPR